jgi:hypothetical protein
MNTEAQLLWKRHKAQEEYSRRRESSRTDGILFYPMYHMFFHLYLRWVLAWIPYGPARFPEPISEDIPFNDPEYQVLLLHFKRAPVELHGVGAFLEVLLGDQFEAIFGCKAAAEDYGYVADTLREEIKKLNPIPDTVVRAFEWLDGQIALSKISSSSAENSTLSQPEGVESIPNGMDTSVEIKPSHRQIALLHIYLGSSFVLAQATEAALEAGYDAPSSGRSIMLDYNKYRTSTSRKEVSDKDLVRMIRDITQVIPRLTGKSRQQAEEDLRYLKNRQ